MLKIFRSLSQSLNDEMFSCFLNDFENDLFPSSVVDFVMCLYQSTDHKTSVLTITEYYSATSDLCGTLKLLLQVAGKKVELTLALTQEDAAPIVLNTSLNGYPMISLLWRPTFFYVVDVLRLVLNSLLLPYERTLETIKVDISDYLMALVDVSRKLSRLKSSQMKKGAGLVSTPSITSLMSSTVNCVDILSKKMTSECDVNDCPMTPDGDTVIEK